MKGKPDKLSLLAAKLEPGKWYRHPESAEQLEYRFKVIRVRDGLVDVVDKFGNLRTFSANGFADDMVLVQDTGSRAPMTPLTTRRKK